MNRRIAIALPLAWAAVAAAQEVKDVRVEVRHGSATAVAGAVPPGAATFHFLAAEPGQIGKVVAGAPYSGEAFTESVQTLADGTRITHRGSRKLARDGQGRTREEGTISVIGPWASAAEAPRITTIVDPVAKLVYVLNDRDKTAVRTRMPDPAALKSMAHAAGAAAEGKAMTWTTKEGDGKTIEKEIVVTGAAGESKDVLMTAPPPGAGAVVHQEIRVIRSKSDAKAESLGRQTLEGLATEGKRLTHTIPANEIGNDRPLVSTVETWTSPELQVTVRSITKDPQAGETTYRLTNISRAEPAKSLFQVPADYTIKDGPEPAMFRMRMPKQ